MDKLEWFGIIIVLALSVVIGIGVIQSDKSQIHNWAERNDYQIQSIESCVIDNGPFFWRDNEDARIYKVKILDHNNQLKISYFRFEFGMEQQWVN